MAKQIVMKNQNGTVAYVRYECDKNVDMQPFHDLYKDIKGQCIMSVTENEFKKSIWFTFTVPVMWE